MKIAFVLDPLDSIKTYKDSSYALMQEAVSRGHTLASLQQEDLVLRDGRVLGYARDLALTPGAGQWYRVGERTPVGLETFDAVMMRKDPPFDMEYIYATYLLELAEAAGVLVVNAPQGLRDANEKLFTAWFPQCCPESLVTRDRTHIRSFLEEHGDIILKPLDGMGGASIFRVRVEDLNNNVIIETLTAHGRRFTMAQRFIPEITEGDKRILLIDGHPVPYALARYPAPGETRGNLAAGGRSAGVALSERDRWICAEVGETLRRKGLVFVGLDVIGDYLTEINVTSPTCLRELDALYGLDIAGQLMDAIEQRLR
jgi:glutathione synthase